jgi:hypothetical protein
VADFADRVEFGHNGVEVMLSNPARAHRDDGLLPGAKRAARKWTP